MSNATQYIGWQMDNLKAVKVADHVHMAQDSHIHRIGCEATHIYCHASQVALFDGLGYTVKVSTARMVINPGVFWIGIA